MKDRKFSAWSILSVGVACWTLLLMTSTQIQAKEPTLAEQLRQSERILVGVPESDVDVAGGEQFLVKIEGVLRGSGTKGELARIVQSGDKTRHPKFQAKKQYVFLLKDNVGGPGWLYQGVGVLPVVGDAVQYVIDGKKAEEVPLEDFQMLVAKNPLAEPEVPKRSDLAGRWIVALSQQGSDFYVWLVDVTKEKDEYSAKLVATSKILSASTLKSFSVTATDATFVFVSDGREFDFTGHLENGIVRGNIEVGGQAVVPSFMVATAATTLKNYNEPRPAAGQEEFVKAAQEPEPFDMFEKLVKQFPESPLALDAYRALIALSKKMDVKEAKFKTLAEDYRKTASMWGARLELKAQVDCGLALAQNQLFPELALTYLTAAESKFNDKTPAPWKSMVQTEHAKLLIAQGKAAEGIALLTPLHAASPYEPEITYVLAQQAEKEKKTDEAMALYAEIVALPMLERTLQMLWSQQGEKVSPDKLPVNILKRLWKEKYENTKELPAYLNEVYEKKILAFPHAKAEPRKPDGGTRVVLFELFTGAMCPPCVGADVATEAIEATYPQSEVIVLRYHQNIPGPDPLANEESAKRFAYYMGEGTPTLTMDGKKLEGVGGFLANAEALYTRLKGDIDPTLKEKIELKVDLSAKAEKGIITVTAKASGLETFPEEVRLRLVLAEDKVAFPAKNGIRFHEMVVRAMPAGADGIAPADGKLQYEGKINLADLKASLAKTLAKVEAEVAEQFEEKPMELKALHLVGFLQKDSNQEVLQAASIPVTGDLNSTADGDEKAKPEAKAEKADDAPPPAVNLQPKKPEVEKKPETEKPAAEKKPETEKKTGAE